MEFIKDILGYGTSILIFVLFLQSLTWGPPGPAEDPDAALGRAVRKVMRMLK